MIRSISRVLVHISVLAAIAAGLVFIGSNVLKEQPAKVASASSKLGVAPSTGSSSNQSSTSTSTSPSSSSTGSLASAQTISDVTSNWSGYAATKGTFTSISGSWIVPDASSSGYTSADASWIGIGGVSSDDLIQVGTQNVVSPEGDVSTSAFYELLPDNSTPIDSMSISAGDQVTANIKETSDDVWSIKIEDTTTGQVYQTTVDYDSSESSAEWIEEDPSDGNSQIPFDNFGTVDFSNGSTLDNGSNESISSSSAQALTLENSDGEELADVSSLGSNGSSFNVVRTTASSVQEIYQFNSDPSAWVRRGMGIGGFNRSDGDY
jgi:hypothetical protein